MGATKRVLFEKCPLCRKGMIEMAARNTLTGTASSIEPCSVCGAVFTQSGTGRFKLAYCDPHRLATIKGKKYPRSVCDDCMPLVECWIGMTLPRADWEALAEGRTIAAWAAYEDPSEEFDVGVLTDALSGSGVVSLSEDEVVHHTSLVHLSEVVIPGDSHDEAQLLLTSRRILIVHQSLVYDIRLADIEKVEQSFPGFIIKARGVEYPLYCFPVPGDPVYHAIVGALKRIH